jgi:hypothetical protein
VYGEGKESIEVSASISMAALDNLPVDQYYRLQLISAFSTFKILAACCLCACCLQLIPTFQHFDFSSFNNLQCLVCLPVAVLVRK